MKEDQTAIVTARRRDPSAKQFLRRTIGQKKHEAELLKQAKAQAKTDLGMATPEDADVQAPNTTAAPNAYLRFKKRQINKTWLPTQMWHAKRAHMTPPREPLWKFAIPLAPTEKSYRMTHRASTLQGCVAWDTSYTSTIGVEGDFSALLAMFRSLGLPEGQLTKARGLKWRQGSRAWSGWPAEPFGKENLVAEILIHWCPPVFEEQTRKAFVRVHPSAFHSIWDLLSEQSKLCEPPPALEDLRFDLGSVELTGPSSMEALTGLFTTVESSSECVESNPSSRQVFSQLSAVTNSLSVPTGAVISLSISDPRLAAPRHEQASPRLDGSGEELALLMSKWPLDGQPGIPQLFDRETRQYAAKHHLTQKQISRRKGHAASGTNAAAMSTDSKIPIVLLAQNHGRPKILHGSWTVIMPWKCLPSLWYPLMYFPLAGGGNPRFGGLEQSRQRSYEQNLPWFPADYPGTNPGWHWELRERAKRKTEWERRPKDKRIEWASVDLGKGRTGELGLGWACDWEYLIKLRDATISEEPVAAGTPRRPDETEALSPASCLLHPSLKSIADFHALTPIALSLVGRGLPTTCARIYRLPATNMPLRAAWLALVKVAPLSASDDPQREQVPERHKRRSLGKKVASSSISGSRAALAAALLEGPQLLHSQIIKADDPRYPMVPDAEDLIGFVTTGNYNLGAGRGTAIGNIVLAAATFPGDNAGLEIAPKIMTKGLCIVREAGSSIGRLAKWETISN